MSRRPFVPVRTERLLRVLLQRSIQLVVRVRGRHVDDDAVIYAGFYTRTLVPGAPSPWVKVAFPMPKGCTTVILRPENLEGGGLRLASWGKRFGEPGAYRLHGAGPSARVAYVPVHERFDLWVEDGGALVRCDHRFSMWRLEFLLLRYRMRRTAS